MALFVFRDWDNDLDNMRPSQLLDQHFGLGLSPADLLAPLTIPHQQHQRLHLRPSYYRPWRVQRRNQDSGSLLNCDKDQFKVNLDVQQFSPEEVQVKVVDNSVVVEAKHEEKQDEHGYISRQFVRRYLLPEGHDIQQVSSSLSSDGILTITVPKAAAIENKERVIPITQTGPHKAVEKSATEEKKEEK